MSKTNKIVIGIVAAITAMGLLIATFVSYRAVPSIGSVSQGSAYLATTTGAFVASAGLDLTVLKSGWGVLGSVTITSAAVGQINIYDATTSDVNLRSSLFSTTSIQRVNIPASLVAGTYVFDIIMPNGILLEITGTAPTSTISYR